MVDILIIALGIVVVLILLAVSGLLSSSEVAIFSLSRADIDRAVEGGDRRALTLKRLRADAHQVIVTTLVGNTVVTIAIAAVIALLLLGSFDPLEALLGTIVISAIGILLVGEFIPRSYGAGRAESWALRVAKPIAIFQTVMRPIAYPLGLITRLVNRLSGGRTAYHQYITEEATTSLGAGPENAVAVGFGWADEGLLDRVWRPVETAMTDRSKMPTVSVDAGIERARDTCLDSGSSYLVVIDRDADDVVGVLTLQAIVSGLETDRSLSAICADPVFISADADIGETLVALADSPVPVAVVVDEFGSTVGSVAHEELLATLATDVIDRSTVDPIEPIDDRRTEVRGDVPIAVLNRRLDLSLPEGDAYETVAGLLYETAGRLLERGEEVDVEGVRFRVQAVADHRIISVRLEHGE